MAGRQYVPSRPRPSVNRTWYSVVDRTLELVDELQPQVRQRLISSQGPDSLRSLSEAIASATGTELTDDDFARQYSEALACGSAVIALAGPLFHDPRVRTWVLNHANPLWKGIIEEAFVLSPSHEVRPETAAAGGLDPILAFYEVFLQRHDRRRRTRHGVFYTPPPIARYILSQAHRLLIERFGLDDGLADTATWGEMTCRSAAPSPPPAAGERGGVSPPVSSPRSAAPSLPATVYERGGVSPPVSSPRSVPPSLPPAVRPEDPFVRVLDPALGAGVFLTEGLKLVHTHLAAKWAASGTSGGQIADRWDEYAADHLLPRWYGLELMLPACIVATLKLVTALAETGFSFTRPSRLEIYLANTLAGPPERQRTLFADRENAFLPAAAAGRDSACRIPFTVIVGNPPFSGISHQQGRWIVDLLRGTEGGRGDWGNYFQVDGQPLGERKTWLQDDYVKFVRFAHWKIETTGSGIVGLVTNHGYLDNPTFRGVRQQLLATFPHITVIDLHGNRKKKEITPDGRPDENVFEIEQGTAIGLLCRPPADGAGRELDHGELWGSAEGKRSVLEQAAKLPAAGTADQTLAIRRVVPAAPQYFFAPRPTAAEEEYDGSPRLPDLMPVNVTAPVTARDGFVVAFSREELLARIAEFRDLDVGDDEIRQRYFTKTRSAKYAAGDTRGWKLAEARRRLAADPGWQEHVRPCWYRPFDERVVYWADRMIDWPRDEVTPYLLRPDNIALVARRQMLPTQPCNYFWVTDQLLLDGLIRSDNRGSESVFPLHLEPTADDRGPPYRFNFDEAFLERAARQMGIRWQSDGGRAGDAFPIGSLLSYSYALFFSPEYRRRYADRLWSDFPRVLLPRRPDLFRALVGFGEQLTGWHLLRELRHAVSPLDAADAPTRGSDGWRWSLGAAPVVAPGFPKYGSGRISVNRDVWLEPVPTEIWDFHVGGHQVCRKWLKDRRGRTLSDRDLAVYFHMVSAIRETLRIMREIDTVVQVAGGWPNAFAPAEC